MVVFTVFLKIWSKCFYNFTFNLIIQGKILIYKQKNHLERWLYVLERAMGLALPPLRSFAIAHRHPKVCLSLVFGPLLRGSYSHLNKKRGHHKGDLFYYWSGQWDSDPRHQPWQGCALPLSYTRISCERVI